MADFKFQFSTNLQDAAPAGTQRIVIAETPGVRIGHRLYLGSGADREEVRVALIGEPRVLTSTVTMGTWTREVRTMVRDLTLSAPLRKEHAAGAAVVDNIPTPGRPNSF